MKSTRYTCCILSLLLLFCSCHNTDYEDFYGGTPVDSDILRSAALLLEAETEKVQDVVITDAAGTRQWFWTQSGEVYHCTADCSRLQSAKIVFSGALEEALQAGKERACATCCKESP